MLGLTSITDLDVATDGIVARTRAYSVSNADSYYYLPLVDSIDPGIYKTLTNLAPIEIAVILGYTDGFTTAEPAIYQYQPNTTAPYVTHPLYTLSPTQLQEYQALFINQRYPFVLTIDQLLLLALATGNVRSFTTASYLKDSIFAGGQYIPYTDNTSKGTYITRQYWNVTETPGSGGSASMYTFQKMQLSAYEKAEIGKTRFIQSYNRVE